ncbi:MAG: divalent-cation tolerance protein CutA [Saprospiraceae bacterium]|nr:divalent-cation tolerance protein CutA [Saprospiraceae bacterium]
MKITLLYIPFPNVLSAKKISKILLKEKFAACVQLIPVDSLFQWNGKIVNSKEIALLVKTLDSKKKKAKNLILEHHPYEIPCIIQTNVQVNKSYFEWMKTTLA